MKDTCSRCGGFKEAERMFTQSYCRECKNEYDRGYKPTKPRIKKTKAREKSRYAVKKGILKKQPCEICQKRDTVMHHDDYDKPLEVRWLCEDCHDDHHRKERQNQL